MELIRINERKIKIMLTPSDMTQFELKADRIGEDSEEAHRAFRHLLDEVRRQTDLELDDRRIAVQYFPSREGGCEMFVSSSQPICAGKEKKKEKEKLPALPACREEKTISGFRRDGAYRFDSLDALLRVCERLRGVGYIGESEAYKDEQNRYFLLLRFLSPSPFALPDSLAFVNEYGRLENASQLRLYFREHARLIRSPDAVETLAGLR